MKIRAEFSPSRAKKASSAMITQNRNSPCRAGFGRISSTECPVIVGKTKTAAVMPTAQRNWSAASFG